MKTNEQIFALLLLNLCVFLCAAQISAQTGRKIEPTPAATNLPEENKTPAENVFPSPKYQYEYIAPQTIVDFMYELKARAKRGFRLYKVTVTPGEFAATAKQKSNKTVLSGIVRYDGEQKYDYNFFFAEGEGDPGQKMSALAGNGWYFREDIMIYGGGADSDTVFANSLYDLPTVGNLYILERTSGEPSNKIYKLLKAGQGLGKNPTPKMQGLLAESVAEGFTPVATYYSFDVKGLLSVDSFFGVLMEKSINAGKSEDKEKIENEYRFVRSNRSNGLQKAVEEAAKEGFRVHTMNFNSAVLAREKSKTTPVAYRWLNSDDKKFATEYAEAVKGDIDYAAGGIDMLGNGDFIKSLMLFETNAANNTPGEFQIVNMIPVVPKQYRKNREEYLKTLGDPQEKLDRLQSEGFQPRDILYSDALGLQIILEKNK